MTNVKTSPCKVPVVLVRFQLNLNFLGKFSKEVEIWNFIKIRRVGAELFHEDRRTDTKLVVAFRNFAKAPDKSCLWLKWCQAIRYKRYANAEQYYVVRALPVL